MAATSDSSEETCCICLESLHKPCAADVKLACGHVLHEECAAELRRRGSSARCPLCRAAPAEELMTVQDMLDRASECFRSGSFDEAWRWASQACDAKPDSARAHRVLAEIYENRLREPSDINRAREHYEMARSLGDVHATVSLGVLFKRQGDLRRARAFYEEAWSRGNVSAACNLGNLYRELGDVAAATAFYEEARRKGHAVATFNLGNLCQVQGDAARARALWEEAYARGHAGAAFNLGVLCHQQGDVTRARELWAAARAQGHEDAAFNLDVVGRKASRSEKLDRSVRSWWRATVRWSKSDGPLPHAIPEGDCAYELLVR